MKCLFALAASILWMSFANASYQGELYGSTQSEREIKWVWRHLNDFVWSCAASSSHCQDPAIKSVVGQLATYVPEMTYDAFSRWETLLVFVSEKDRPDLFKTGQGEVHRIAVTEFKKYATVYVNTDRMNLSYEKWIGILSHELVHHLGIPDDENRLADQVGAEIQKHTVSQLQVATLEQFKLPFTKFITFNSVAPGRQSATLITDPDRSGDMGWAPTPFAPICNPDEKLVSQFVMGPAWRVNRLQAKKAVVGIRGSGYMRAICERKLGGGRRTLQLPMNAIVYLQYSKPFNFDSWMNEAPTRTFNQDELAFAAEYDFQAFGPLQTFYVLSTTHEKTQLRAGDTWKTSIVVQGTDGFVPRTCNLYLAGAEYSYILRDGLSGVNEFEHCRISELGNNQWRIDGETQLPEQTRPDRYFVTAIGLVSGNEGRLAVPVFPTYLQVTNPQAPKAPVIRNISIAGLFTKATEGKMLPGQSLTNSFMANADQVFEVSFLVEGPQKISDLWFDLTIWFYNPPQNTFLPGQGTGSSTSFPQVVKKETFIPTTNGTEVHLTFQMPQTVSGIPVAAIKMKRFYMRTSDFSWVEIESQSLSDAMVLNPAYGK